MQREGEQRMLQRKSRIQPKLLGTTLVEKKYMAVFSHTYSLLRPLKGAIYTLAVVPEPSIREGIAQGCLFLLVFPCLLPVKKTQNMEGQHLPCKQKQNLPAESHNLVPCDQLKLEVHLKKGIWKAAHQGGVF